MTAFDSRLKGDSAEFARAKNTARLIANTGATVLITGESGTGKEFFAEAIHEAGPRSAGPFVTLNCAAIPDGLLEAELFGYRKGAFTGASGHQAGHILAADGGTLFMDEVGELSAPAQGKLLRFLESQQIQPLGSAAPRQVNVRLIAATNCDLLHYVQEGRFRDDLYYRLNVVPLEIPPLRQRGNDLRTLLKYFTGLSARQHELPAPHYTSAAIKALKEYAWPGNVRELRNLCERMVILLPGGQVDASNLPHAIRHPDAARHNSGFILPAGGINLNALEEDVLRQALEQSRGNQSAAARLLGITRDTFLYRLQKYAIEH